MPGNVAVLLQPKVYLKWKQKGFASRNLNVVPSARSLIGIFQPGSVILFTPLEMSSSTQINVTLKKNKKIEAALDMKML